MEAILQCALPSLRFLLPQSSASLDMRLTMVKPYCKVHVIEVHFVRGGLERKVVDKHAVSRCLQFLCDPV